MISTANSAIALDRDIGGFFDDKHRVAGRKVSSFLRLHKADMSTASKLSESSIRYDDRMPVELEIRLTEWAAAINLVGNHFQSLDKAMLWFKLPNPLLGNVSPRDMIVQGRSDKLLAFIRTALAENRR